MTNDKLLVVEYFITVNSKRISSYLLKIGNKIKMFSKFNLSTYLRLP